MDYVFQKKKRSTAYKFFSKGVDATAHILLALHENAQLASEGFLRNCPQYPGFGLVREMFGAGGLPKLKKEIVRTNFYRLEKQGLIKKDPKKKVYYLTDKGEEFACYIENRFLILNESWDKKLRIVIFDIPEQKRYWRVYLKQELELMQFKQLQKSVYVGRYPLPESLIKEIEKDGMGKFIYIFTIDQTDREEEILKIINE